MKLIVFNKTTQSHRVQDPAVRFSKSGAIYINKKGMELMGLQIGNTISLAQDGERKKDWYLFRDADGMIIRVGSKTTESFLIANATAASELRLSLGLDPKKNFTLKLATTPVEENGKAYYALLTSQIVK